MSIHELNTIFLLISYKCTNLVSPARLSLSLSLSLSLLFARPGLTSCQQQQLQALQHQDVRRHVHASTCTAPRR